MALFDSQIGGSVVRPLIASSRASRDKICMSPCRVQIVGHAVPAVMMRYYKGNSAQALKSLNAMVSHMPERNSYAPRFTKCEARPRLLLPLSLSSTQFLEVC